MSTPATVGRISGIGWGAGYIGGIVLLLILVIRIKMSAFVALLLVAFGVLGAVAFTVGKYGVGSLKQLGLLVVLYAAYYLSDDDPIGRFFAYLLLFAGAMLGVVLSENVLLLVGFWELTSLTSLR